MVSISISEVLISFYLFISLALALLISTIGCDSHDVDQDDPETNVGPVSEANVESTKEYLESLPLPERQQAQWHLDQEKREALKHNARQQVKKWIAESTPQCLEFFGSKNCNLALMELQPSEICGFKFHNALSSIEELKAKGHYYVSLVNANGYTSGGYMWIASYGHQAYMDGAVLNITQCWAVNPSEIGQDPLPTKPPGPTSIFDG